MLLTNQPASIPVTTVAERGHALHDPCIDEMENCSLQENERCNCVWQLMRSVHAIFHWLNRISCVRHGKCKSHGTEEHDEAVWQKTKHNDHELTIFDASNTTTTLENQTSNKLDNETRQPQPLQPSQPQNYDESSAAMHKTKSQQNDDADDVERSNKATFAETIA